MKLTLLSAVLLLAAPEAAVRFEAEGVRVGAELVSGKEISLKGHSPEGAGTIPILVSGTMVESLSADGKTLSVAVTDGRSVLLETGVRLERVAEGFRLSTHGPAFTVEAGGKSIAAETAVTFTLTEKGFDFGTAGVLEGSAALAKVSKVAAQDPPQDPRKRQVRGRTVGALRSGQARLVFGNGDPTVLANFASAESLKQLTQVTPTGGP